MLLLKDIVSVLEPLIPLNESDLTRVIDRIAPLDKAQEGDLSFLSSAKYRRQLGETQATVVLLAEKDLSFCPESTIAVVVADPYVAFAKVSQLFDLSPKSNGIDSSAVVHSDAKLGTNVAIGPNAVIGKGVVLGDNVQIGAGTVIEDWVSIGRDSVIFPNVSIMHRCQIGERCVIQSGTVIGGKGFGYAPNQGQWEPIAQLGAVVIGDRVEIGSNCCIDRGAVEDTEIESDVIIDNLVQIGHNCKIGQGTAIVSQVGIAGSTVVGKNCTFGGQAGVAGHITIADGSFFTGRAMVTKGTTEPGIYSSGLPMSTNREWRKTIARIRQLESMHNRITELEKQLKEEGKE